MSMPSRLVSTPDRPSRLARRLCSLLAPAALVSALAFASLPTTAWAATTPTPAPNTTNPFSPGVPIPQATAPTATSSATPNTFQTTTSTSSGGGLSGTAALEIAIVAVLVLGGIAFFIWRDARRRAPLRRTPAGEVAGMPGSASRGSKAAPKPRKLSPAERRRRKRGRAKR